MTGRAGTIQHYVGYGAGERLVEEMRLLGCEAMQSWADERVVATEQKVRL
ncbi:MAG: hypothetical protein FD149_2668, partial [Rhodospirillaceae bacterium]